MSAESSPAMQRHEASPTSPHREAISRALTRYYTLLTQFPYLPDAIIEHAPAAGWNLDTAADLRRVGQKSAAVIDVLNHIPYLATTTFDVNYDTSAIDWRGERVRTSVVPGEGPEILGGLGPGAADIPRLQQASLEPMLQRLPESVISLTKASNYGRWLLLDVDTGLVTNYSVLGGPDPKCTDEEREAGLAWKKHETKHITHLFDDWSDKLRFLTWVPLPAFDGNSGTIRTPATVNDAEQEEIRAVYRNHGWDDQSGRLLREDVQRESESGTGGRARDNIEGERDSQANGFRKEECRAALLELQDAHSRKRSADLDGPRAAKAAKRIARLAAAAAAAAAEAIETSQGTGASQGVEIAQ